jgi:hypothetical protein
MSIDDPPQFVPMSYWDAVEEADPDLPAPGTVKRKRFQRLYIDFYGAISAYNASSDQPENLPSVHNCDCSPTAGETGASQSEKAESNSRLMKSEREAMNALLKIGVEDIETAIGLARQGGSAHTAAFAALGRDQERQWKVAALLDAGEIGHAERLATCGRQSVQLQCGCCESEDNYVPVSCDSPLCPDCNDRKIGQNIAKYRGAIKKMRTPALLTFTLRNYRDPAAGREDAVEDFATFRRRTIPFEGETVRERIDGEEIRKSWSWWEGADVDDMSENHEQWKIRLQAQGRHDLVRRLEKQYVHYEWEDVTGTRKGRNIPFSELCEGGLYGVDIKQQGLMQFHVHIHAVVDLAYVPQAALSAVWSDVTDGACVVDVRSIYDREDRERAAEALAETVGYAVKPPEFESLDDELEFVQAAKGCPRVHPFGSLHGNQQETAALRCTDCDIAPATWRYCGTVDQALDTMTKDWETDRGKDPPGDDNER